MYTYDQVWTQFLLNYKADNEDLPSDGERIKEFINNAIMLMNNRLRITMVGDDVNELIVGMVSDDELILLAHYIRLVFLINEKTYYEKLWQPFATDVGLKDFGTQLRSLDSSVKQQKEFIDHVIFNMTEDFL